MAEGDGSADGDDRRSGGFADRLTDGLAGRDLDRLDLDRAAARRATLAAVVAVALLVVGHWALGAAVTAGDQPLGEAEELPTTAADERWERASSRTVSLSRQEMAVPVGGGSVDELEASALTNGSHVAFRLTWTDPTNDTSLAGPEQYSDAAAIMFGSGEEPPIVMGGAGTPVNVWYWRAHWQYGSDERAEWSGDMYSYPHPDDDGRPGAAAGNPLSQARFDSYAHNYYVAGFGSLSHAPEQNVHARGHREGDEWSVVFHREHETEGELDAAFRQDEPMYLAFAVWNGSAGEANSQKSISLQFSQLDTASGELATADDGEEEAGGGGLGPGRLAYYGALLVAAVLAWAVVYRRASGAGPGEASGGGPAAEESSTDESTAGESPASDPDASGSDDD